MESLAGAAILLLTSYRPGYRPPWIDKSYATPPVGPAAVWRPALAAQGGCASAGGGELGALPVARGRRQRTDGRRQRVGGQGARHRVGAYPALA
jgi:hypothetical protein